MNVTLNLNPGAEKALMGRAHARGISVDDYIPELVAKETGSLAGCANLPPIDQRFANLSDLLLDSPFARSDLNQDRPKDSPRAVNPG